ncbi:LOW QUALITY PROTEIN: protein PTST homolog 3, chloroplastic [Prosopis cineraria]|uniref:LOW QUALITY PROTEIN: protein PTST homolog 3, chloroplastic n=1 Tax=Prosopis cineraria TaxID=364024 RepID=UPI00240EF4B3|nr:LOW QUALITY PROTEIN: protein PTST homolog 3, chloroplastic [Prosopis cineraria]
MATVCYFPSCVSASSHNLSLTHHQQLLQPIRDPHPLPKHFQIRASANTTSRRSRKLKSDADLCNDIREFVAAAGLPEDHVPSTKELLQHGRNDLANIVRRRGHKLLRKLLTSSLDSDIDVFHADKNLDGNLDGSDDCKDVLTGQNLREGTTPDDITASTEVSSGNNSSCLNTDLAPNASDYTCISSESSTNSSSMAEIDLNELQHHANEVKYVAEGHCSSTEASIVDDGCSSSREGPDPTFENESSIAAETSGESYIEEKPSQNLGYGDMMSKMTGDTLSSTIRLTESQSSTSFADSDLATQYWCKLGFPDDSNNDVAENVPSSTDIEYISGGIEIDYLTHSADNSCINVNCTSNLSLEEKVAKFIQSGDLDPVEDHAFGILNGNDGEDSEEDIESGSAGEMKKHFKHACKENTAMSFYGSSSTSKQVVPSATANHLVCEDHWQDEDQTAHFDEVFDVEATKRQNESEINNLKFMLYQKELELSQLKEQIEKEKLALYALQTKAEEEINKARKLISEKDAELHVAEESLSGLKEVGIEFFGDGDNVEVAGSFNGWHHRIKMDPQPSTSVMDSTASRRSRLWSTVLWLYPGVYEIKFIVDGYWRIDSQRESVTRGHICNNILRVDR